MEGVRTAGGALAALDVDCPPTGTAMWGAVVAAGAATWTVEPGVGSVCGDFAATWAAAGETGPRAAPPCTRTREGKRTCIIRHWSDLPALSDGRS
jgi:hypothetical protein